MGKIQSIMLGGLLLTSAILAAAEPVSKSRFGGVAIGSHDTVAYHQQIPPSHEATEGNRDFVVEWKDAEWRFATREDRDAFAADPERYAPAYNGFCANALSLDRGLLKTNGTHWQIFGDQLFLFYARAGRERWLDGNHEEYKAAADQAWSRILAEQSISE